MIRIFICNHCGYEKIITEDDLYNFECDICLVGMMTEKVESLLKRYKEK